ncbi:hypothetical protein HID58_056283, partial [Brassica napus]
SSLSYLDHGNTEEEAYTNGSVNSYSLSLDLMIEIFKQLPLKNLIRSLCVSKQWASIICGRYFMKLFLNESLTRPKSVVFVTIFFRCCFFFSHLPCDCSHPTAHENISPSVHGFAMDHLLNSSSITLALDDPATLPKFNAGRRVINHYLGYDPINNDYKVLCIIRGMPKLSNRRGLAAEILVLTLGSSTHQDSWKMMNIQDNIIPHHSPLSEELCINGVFFYWIKLNASAIMSFDVRSEKLALIKGPCTFPTFSKLTSYEEKLAVIFYKKKISGIIALSFCEIIDTPIHEHASQTSFVYFDLKNDSVRNFNIEGITDEYMFCQSNFVSAGQVENLMFL